MDNSMESAMNNMSSGRKGASNYTVEQIEEARKRQKKMGGTFMDNLAAVAGEKDSEARLKAASDNSMSAASLLEGIDNDLKALSEEIDKRIDSGHMSMEELNATLSQLDSNLDADYGMSRQKKTAARAGADKDKAATKQEEPEAMQEGAGVLVRFDGLTDKLKENIYGQDDFIRKLVIAFKRPFVSERDEDDALNSIYITGPAASGKHMALNAIVSELGERKILSTNALYRVDLSLYPGSAEEKLFLQDLYSALQSEANVILFENFEACHISMLTRLSDLVTTGVCRLSERYVMQNGQLISVSNALAGKTVGSFEARGKYLVFISDKPLNKVADIMGAPFVNALGDVCETTALSTEAVSKISADQEKVLTEKCQKQLAYEVTLDESFKDYILAQTSKGRGVKGLLDTYAMTMKALAQLRLERDDLESNALTLSTLKDEPVVICGKEKVELSGLLPSGYMGELDSIKAEMNEIVGLSKVKDYIYSLEEYYGVQKRRREEGLKASEVNKHMIFTGNPGTGKTTIARIVSKYLKAIGVLSGGQLVEVSRADLVGRYQGHTAPLVNQVVKSALGGVLFIDEAYSLYRGEDDSFGLEAIDTLVKGIEDNRDDLVVILAGYSNEMEGFLEANSGLKSRFPNIIDFPDYTGEELLEIAKITARSKGYTIEEEAYAPMKDYFDKVQATNAREAGNGRLVRNKIEEAILNQSKRLVAEPEADMSLLKLIDFDIIYGLA